MDNARMTRQGRQIDILHMPQPTAIRKLGNPLAGTIGAEPVENYAKA